MFFHRFFLPCRSVDSVAISLYIQEVAWVEHSETRVSLSLNPGYSMVQPLK
jgi:hypothetical protein